MNGRPENTTELLPVVDEMMLRFSPAQLDEILAILAQIPYTRPVVERE
jgi:hypothetical protein